MSPAPRDPVSWAAFEAAAPDLATAGRTLLRSRGEDSGFLATVRGDAPPRIHPVTVGVVEGALYVFVLPSSKRIDLELDGRFALHAHQDRNAPGEFAVRGRAVAVDAAERPAVAAAWPFEVDASYGLFELRLEAAVLGWRATADDWPPRYSTWSAACTPAAG